MVAGQAGVTAQGDGRRVRLGSATAALVLGGLVLVLVIVDVPLASLARQSLNSSGGSLPFWYSAAFGLLGFVVAWRKPGTRWAGYSLLWRC